MFFQWAVCAQKGKCGPGETLHFDTFQAVHDAAYLPDPKGIEIGVD